jgi:signal transduction histidine kinase
MSLNKLIFFIALVLTAPAVSGAGPLRLGINPTLFEGQVEVSWKTIAHSEDIGTALEGGVWQSDISPPNLGPGKDPVVYRIEVENKTDQERKFSFVSLDAIVADEVVLGVRRAQGDMEISRSGQMVPRDRWAVDSRLIVLPFKLKPQERATVYLGIRSYYSRNLLYQIMPDESWQRYELKSSIFMAFYFGILAVIIGINIFIWSTTGSAIAKAYLGMCVMTLIASFMGLGFANYFFNSVWPVPASLIESVIVPLTLISIGWFGREYLETKKWARVTWWWYTITMFLAAGGGIIVALRVRLDAVAAFNELMITGTTIIGIVTAIYGVVRKKTPYAWSYLLGVGIYMVAGFIWSRQFSMEIASTPFRVHAIFIGQIAQNLVLISALIRQVNIHLLEVVRTREAARSGQKMGDLVRILTHDLSNYMSIIDAGASVLGRGKIDDALRVSQAGKIKRAIEQQKEVLESIKLMKAMEDGKLSMKLEPVDLSPLLADLHQVFESKLSSKGVRLVTAGGGANIKVLADRRTLFHSVLCNLVSNAIKFSEPLTEIEVSFDESPDEVALRVRDHGIGMPEQLAAKVFNANEKTSRVGTAGEAGTGFGLPICKSFMDFYGGSIAVSSKTKESSPGDHGTTFELRFKKAA